MSEVVGHFWNGSHREVTHHRADAMRGALPPAKWRELSSTGTTSHGWSDYYLVADGEAAPAPRWAS